MSGNPPTQSETQVTFEGCGDDINAPKLTIAGVDADFVNRPDRIFQLMDLLELPKGTSARIVYTTSDVIVR